MENALTIKTEEKKKSGIVSTSFTTGGLNPERATGAPVGLPLFLQRSASLPPLSIQTKLAIGAADDAYEREADEVADKIVSGAPPALLQRKCACGESDIDCETCKQTTGTLQRRATGGAETANVPSSVHETLRSSGQPLDTGTRADMEARFGHDFSGVRVHIDDQAGKTARALAARAYTVNNDVVFGAGQFKPHTVEGQRLIAHELTHVIQQGSALDVDGAVIQREQGGNIGAADATARRAGPCDVAESSLSNEGLLNQLNRSRAYLVQHERGQDEWYDYANLLRRLSAQRRRRVEGGHVWLAEHGLLSVPDELYATEPGDGLRITVRRVPGATAAGPFTASTLTLMTRSQFERFLERQGVPVVDAESYFATLSPDDPLVATLNLPEQTRYRQVSPIANVDLFGRPMETGLFQPSPIGSNLLMPPMTRYGGQGLFAPPSLYGDATMPGGLMNPYPNTVAYTPGSQELLQDVRRAPGAVTAAGSERVTLPGPSPIMTGGPGQPFVMPQGPMGYPEGVGSLGFLGRPGTGLAQGTTGIMWEGAHVSDVVAMNDRLFARGFRASLPTHAQSSLERSLVRGGGPATTQLNVGTPGSYAIDSTFPYSGEITGRGISHWGQGAVAIVRRDGTPIQGEELMRLMVDASRRSGATEAGLGGETYRFSTPPEGNPAYERAAGEAGRRGIPNWCQLGGTNCINVPGDIHSQALGGVDLVIPGPNGEPISLRDPAHASAENMSRLMNMPDSVLEAQGLRRVNIGAQQWRGVGMAAGLGVGASLATDAWRAAHGENVPLVSNALISGGSNVASVVAEDFAYTGMTSAMMRSGASAGTASMLGRVGASTGVGLLAAPLVTGIQMAVDDEQYTRSDYAARMGRSGVAGGGGALATGLFFAACGSEVPVAGNIAGFLIGIAGYYITDAIAGDEVEASIREGMGEGGCTGGASSGR